MIGKRIVLVEWYWGGHHPAFFAYFILALEELGADVLAICPKPEEARQGVAKLRKARGMDPSNGAQTIFRQIKIPRRRFNHHRLSTLSGIDWSLQHFRAIEGLAREWQVESGKRVDLIFYACIYDWDFEWLHSISSFMSLPWSGLYLHANPLRAPEVTRMEKTFRVNLCRGLALLDEGMAPQFAELLGKPVVVFPDLADGQLASTETERTLEHRLKQFAHGRPIVGLFGYLKKSKGVTPLALASRHPGLANVCFAFVGNIDWPNFSADEKKTIEDALAHGENTWSHLQRIPDEEQLNSLMSACDILYAAYLDFPHSSNILAKAALLKKPLIVSEGHLMAERVKQFRMGEIIPQGDVEAIVAAISKISDNPAAWVAETQPRWEDYNRLHSFDRLKESFRELLASF